MSETTADLVLSDDMKAAIDNALADGAPVTIAYVDGDGVPHISFRGSTQAFSDDQLAIWVRDPEGGMLRAIATNPAVALLYRNPATRVRYHFIGRARTNDDPAVRDQVYERSPEIERNFDPERRGVAAVIDLDRVEGRGPEGTVLMERR